MILDYRKDDVQIFELSESVEKNATARDVREALRTVLVTPPAVLVCQVAWGAAIDDIDFDPQPDERVRLSMLNELGVGFAITKGERMRLISQYLQPMFEECDWREIQVVAAALFTAAERRQSVKEIFSLTSPPPLLLPRRLNSVDTTRLSNGLRVDTQFVNMFRRSYIYGSGPLVLAGFMPGEYSISDIVDNLTPTRGSSSNALRFLAGSAVRAGIVSAALLSESGASPVIRRPAASTATVKMSEEIFQLMPYLRFMDKHSRG